MVRPQIGSRENRRPRPDGDLETKLKQILKYMDRSSRAYDSGDEDEAVRLALELRKLLNDTKHSKSLLGQLGLKEKMMFVDSALYPDKWRAVGEAIASKDGGFLVISPILSLADVRANELGAGVFVAPLSEPLFQADDPFAGTCPGLQAFEPWWTTPVVEASSGRCFSRANLVLIIADQDNGAHVDPELDGDFQDLCIDTLGIGYSETDDAARDDEPIPDVTRSLPYSVVRQIAWEVTTTISNWLAARTSGSFALAEPFHRRRAVRWMQMQPVIVGFGPGDDAGHKAQTPE